MTADKPKTSTGLEQNVAGLLCYVLGWVTGIIFLILEKDNKVVKFHAWQSIITFGALTVLFWIFWIILFVPVIGWILWIIVWIASVILWILLMYKAYQGQMWRVPIAGNIAAKQAGV